MKTFSNKTLNALNIAKFVLIIELIFLIIGIFYSVSKPKLYESKLIYSVGVLNVDFMQGNSNNFLVDIPGFILNFRQNPEIFNSACPTIESSNLSFIQSKATPNTVELSVKARDANASQFCMLAVKDLIGKAESRTIKAFLDDNDYMIKELRASQESMIDVLKRSEFNKHSNEIMYVMEFNEMARQIARHKIYGFKAKMWGGKVIFQSPLPKLPIQNNHSITLAIFLLSGLIVASFLRFIKTKL